MAQVYAQAPLTAYVAPKEDLSVELEDSLGRIRADLGDCERCDLCLNRTKLVFGVGSTHADLMIIGEAPGEGEDKVGEPFVGRSGVMLDKMISNVLNRQREDVYITNVVKCRPPGNRDPRIDESEACWSFLKRQVAVVNPKVILLLGSTATRAFLGEGVNKVHGRWHGWEDWQIMSTFHPAYLMRRPNEKSKAFEDLTMVKNRLKEET